MGHERRVLLLIGAELAAMAMGRAPHLAARTMCSDRATPIGTPGPATAPDTTRRTAASSARGLPAASRSGSWRRGPCTGIRDRRK